MSALPKKLMQFSMLVCLGHLAISNGALSANAKELSLLKSEQSMRSKFTEQPNIEKGEFALPMQASIIYVMKQPLTEFLYQVTSRNGVTLNLTESVSGDLKKISLPMELDLILPELSKSHGLQWHFQNRDLYVSSNLEDQSRIIKMSGMDLDGFHAELKRAGIKPGSNRVQYNKQEDTLLVIGSKQFILTAEKIIKLAKPS